MSNFNELLKRYDRQNGEHISVDGKNYFFTQQPYPANRGWEEACYEAVMISDSDPVDVDGCVPAYEVQWAILPDWDDDDECNACIWETPDNIRSIGYLDTADGHIC